MTIKVLIKCDRCGKEDKITYGYSELLSLFIKHGPFFDYVENFKEVPKVLKNWKFREDKEFCKSCDKEVRAKIQNIINQKEVKR